MAIDINKHEVDIDNLFKQNENDLNSIKELYRKLKEMEKKISQIKYIDTNLADKLKKDYEKLKKVILDENIQLQLDNKINEVNSQLNTIEKIKKFRYGMFTFEARNLTDNKSKLAILLSNDGIMWENLDIDYISPNLRDPFCFVKDDYYYITATNLVTNSNVTYLRSKDLIHFEEITTPYTGLSAYSSIWAPSVFKFNNDYYMTVSLSVNNSDIYGMNQYVTKLDNNLIPTTWNVWSSSSMSLCCATITSSRQHAAVAA